MYYLRILRIDFWNNISSRCLLAQLNSSSQHMVNKWTNLGYSIIKIVSPTVSYLHVTTVQWNCYCWMEEVACYSKDLKHPKTKYHNAIFGDIGAKQIQFILLWRLFSFFWLPFFSVPLKKLPWIHCYTTYKPFISTSSNDRVKQTSVQSYGAKFISFLNHNLLLK